MQRSNCVRDDQRKSPPVEADGPSAKSKTGDAAAGVDFGSALLEALQARFRVKALMEVETDILARRERGLPDLDPAERGENRAIFREAFEVYRGTWPEPVRRYFHWLVGVDYDAFDHAFTVVGEALYDEVPSPKTGFGNLITPEVLGDE